MKRAASKRSSHARKRPPGLCSSQRSRLRHTGTCAPRRADGRRFAQMRSTRARAHTARPHMPPRPAPLLGASTASFLARMRAA
eukprot:1525186-Pleurochrysis_carterae.AAC.1